MSVSCERYAIKVQNSLLYSHFRLQKKLKANNTYKFWDEQTKYATSLVMIIIAATVWERTGLAGQVSLHTPVSCSRRSYMVSCDTQRGYQQPPLWPRAYVICIGYKIVRHP